MPMLDVVRVFAAVSVFFFHAYHNMQVDYGALNGYVSQGNICMTLFFLLSGFLLAYTGRNRSYDSPEEVRSFLKKRFITLMPLCYLLSLRKIILERYGALKILTALPFDLIPSYPMFNFYDFGMGRGFWFIADILIAYALFPVLIKPIRRLRCVDAALLLTALYLLRCTMENIQEVFGGGPYYLYSIPLPRLMEFFMGTLLYRVASEWPVKNEGKMRRALLRLAVPVLLALVVFLTDAWADYLEIYTPLNGNLPFITIPLFIALLLTAAFAGDMTRLARPLTFLSRLSYPFWMATVITNGIMRGVLSEVTSRILISLLVNIGLSFVLYGFQLAIEALLRRLGKCDWKRFGRLFRGLLLVIFAGYFALNAAFFFAPALKNQAHSAYDFEHEKISNSKNLHGFYNDEGSFAWIRDEAAVRLKLKDSVLIKTCTAKTLVDKAETPPTLSVYLEGEHLGDIPLSTEINEARFAVPEAWQGKTGELTLRCSAMFIPSHDVADSDDSRELSCQIYYIGEYK